jgi:large subunit ribosomal protein L16
MLQPVRTRWRKAHKGRIHGTATRASSINYGAFALKALQPERITGKQIEAARVALTTYGIIGIKVWIYKGEVFAREFSQETNKVTPKEGKE